MHQIFQKLENILEEEASLYREIYNLEKDKTEAAIEKNGTLLQGITSSQENLVFRIESLESERGMVLSVLSAESGVSREAALSEILTVIDKDSSARIMKYGAELKTIMLKLRDKQDTNKKLLQDNIEFFSILISDLKNSSSLKSGYGSDGKESVRVMNPVLFNTKA